jgi:hypothetical protein
MSDASKLLRNIENKAHHNNHKAMSASIKTAAFISVSAAAAFVFWSTITGAGLEIPHPKLRALAPAPKFTICTYFEPLGLSEENDNKTREMVHIWQESWTNNGWGTRILTSKDATLHPRHNAILETLLKLPTVNAQAYEMACYVRWVAAIATGCKVHISCVPARHHLITTDPTPPRGSGCPT